MIIFNLFIIITFVYWINYEDLPFLKSQPYLIILIIVEVVVLIILVAFYNLLLVVVRSNFYY